MVPNASVASPRSAAELAAPLALADCVAFPRVSVGEANHPVTGRETIDPGTDETA
jgi:hypothetical protein